MEEHGAVEVELDGDGDGGEDRRKEGECSGGGEIAGALAPVSLPGLRTS
jgi:hypothetical protein